MCLSDAHPTWQTADRTTTTFSVYNSLDKVFQLYTTLLGSSSSSSSSEIAKFRFLVDWMALSAEEKMARYSEYVSHEVNLFLFFKDKPFFESVVLPFLKNKLQKVVPSFLMSSS